MSSETCSDDRIYLHARREAILILVVWALCGIYTVGYCYLFGYISDEPMSDSLGPPAGDLFDSILETRRDPESITFPLGLGIPDWVFYGVLLPWGICIAFTIWFCLFYFVEDELPEERREESQGSEES